MARREPRGAQLLTHCTSQPGAASSLCPACVRRLPRVHALCVEYARRKRTLTKTLGDGRREKVSMQVARVTRERTFGVTHIVRSPLSSLSPLCDGLPASGKIARRLQACVPSGRRRPYLQVQLRVLERPGALRALLQAARGPIRPLVQADVEGLRDCGGSWCAGDISACAERAACLAVYTPMRLEQDHS